MWNKPTQEQLAKVPPLGSQSNVALEDIVIYLHFFIGSCDWYIAEFDGEDTFFGYANLGDPEMAEWGTISFRELQEVTMQTPILENGKRVGILPVEVDCDRHWQPKRFGDIKH